MHTKRQSNIATIATLLIAALLIVTALTGCARMQELDKQLWGTGEPEPTTQPGGSPAAGPTAVGIAPPIIELTAAILAAGGFGGMATWIKRIRRKENGRIDGLAERVQNLEYEKAARSHES